MSEAAEFNVEEAGAPRLGGQVDDGEAAQPIDPAAMVVLAWTPPEVAAAIAQWWNLGCIWFGPGWQAKQQELTQVSVLMAPYFDQWFPKAAGGDPGLVVVGLACLGTGITMALSRAPVVAKHWRKPWIAEQLQAAEQGQPAPAPGAAAAAPAATETEAPAAGTSYKLPRDLAAVVQPGPGDSLAGLGI